MKSNMKILYTIVFLVFCAACTSSPKNQTESSNSNADNDLIKLKDLDGNPIDLSKYEGKALFVNFWATWCAPCIKEMPSLEKMQKAFDEDQPIVFFYASNEPLAKIKKFADQKPWDLNYAQLDMSLEELSIYALPTTIIFKDGKVAWTETGSKIWDSEESISEIKTLINQ